MYSKKQTLLCYTTAVQGALFYGLFVEKTAKNIYLYKNKSKQIIILKGLKTDMENLTVLPHATHPQMRFHDNSVCQIS